MLFDADGDAVEFPRDNFYSVPFVLLNSRVKDGSSIDPDAVITQTVFTKANGSTHWKHAKTAESIIKVFDQKYLPYLDSANPGSEQFLRSLAQLAHAVAPQLQKSLEVLYDESLTLTDFKVDIEGNPLKPDDLARIQAQMRPPELVDSTSRERWMTRNLAQIREYLYWISVGGATKKTHKAADIVAILQRIGVPLSAAYAHLGLVPETTNWTIESDDDYDENDPDEAPDAAMVQPGLPLAAGQAVPQFPPQQFAAPAPSPAPFAAPAPTPMQFEAASTSPAQFAAPAPSPAQFAAPAASPAQFAAAAAAPSPQNAGQVVLSSAQLQAFRAQQDVVEALRQQVLAQEEELHQRELKAQSLNQQLVLVGKEQERAVLFVTEAGKAAVAQRERELRQAFLDERNGLLTQFATGKQNLEAEKVKIEREKALLKVQSDEALRLKDEQLVREEAEKKRLADEKAEIAARAAQQSKEALALQQTAAARAQELMNAQQQQHEKAALAQQLEVEKLNDKMKSYKATLAESTTKNEALARDVAAAKAETQAERVKIAASEAEMNRLRVLKDESEAELLKAKQLIAEQKLNIASLNKDILEKNSKAAAASPAPSGASSSASSSGGVRSDQRIRQLENDLKIEQAKYAASNIEHTKFADLYAAVQPKLDKARKDRRDLENPVAELESQVAVLKSKLSTADQLGAAMRSLSGGQQPLQSSSSNAAVSAADIALLEQQLVTALANLAARDVPEAMWNVELPIAQDQLDKRSIVPSFEADGSLRLPPGSVKVTHTPAQLFVFASSSFEREKVAAQEAAAYKTAKEAAEFELRTVRGEADGLKLKLASLQSIPVTRSIKQDDFSNLKVELAI